MPTRSGTGPRGSRALGPLSLWGGTSGNKVGVGFTLRTRKDLRRFSEAAGLEFDVAITRLAKHAPVFRLLFALSIIIFVFYSLFFIQPGRSAVPPYKGQVTHSTLRAR